MNVMTGSDSRVNKDLRIVNASCIPSMIPSLENLICSKTRCFLLKDVVTLLFHLENRLLTLKSIMFFLQLTTINFSWSLSRVLKSFDVWAPRYITSIFLWLFAAWYQLRSFYLKPEVGFLLTMCGHLAPGP